MLWLASESDEGSVISKYKIEWELEGTVVGSHLKLASECTDGAPCEHVIGSLVKGKQYAIRVHAHNAYGFSLNGGEASETPCTVASPPSLVNVRAITPGLLPVGPDEYSASSASLVVEFGPSADDGGKPVTAYKVEWDALELLAYDYGASSSSLLFSESDIYSIMVTTSTNDVSGTWRAEVGGYATGPISAVADKSEVQAALNSLPTVGIISVIRRDAVTSPGYGYEWIVSRNAISCFDTTETIEGTVGKCSRIDVSTNADAAPGSSHFGSSASLGTLAGTNPEVTSQRIVVGFDGFEQQAVTLEVNTGFLGGAFVLSLHGYSTMKLAWDISASGLETALLPIAGKVLARRTITDPGRSIRWNIVFIDLIGNVSPLELDVSEIIKTDFGASLSGNVKKVRTGSLPTMESALRGSLEVQEPGEVVINNLVPGALYHVVVSSYNGVSLVWGARKAATPVAISASLPFRSPLGVVAVPVSSSMLNVSWTLPFTPQYGMLPSMYKVDWDGSPGISEIQRVTISGATSGTFRLKFDGATTLPIAWNADASSVEFALNALPTIGTVLVQRTLPGEWLVTFSNNVGDLPMMLGLSTALTPSIASIAIDEVVTGMDPPFDQGMVGLTPLPLGSVIVEPLSALQAITITAAAGDLHGTFVVEFQGSSSVPISASANASEVQQVLEGVPTIGEVAVVREDIISNSPPFLERRGYRWLVTLLHYGSGPVPSMLVSTQGGVVGTLASSGTILGSFPIVEVTTVREGGLPQSQVVELGGILSPSTTDTTYFTRVSAHSASHGWGAFAIAPVSTRAEPRPPPPPQNVVAGILSDSVISVSWEPPALDGGTNITGYAVQWSGDKAFTSMAEIIAPAASLSHIITSLAPGQQQYVRVLARNAIGFSEPANAVSRSSREIQRVDLVISSGATSCLAGGSLTLSTTHPVTLQPIVVGPLSLNEDGNSLANTLQLQAEAPVRAERTDSSSLGGYDTSGVSTSDLSIHYLVSFDDGFDWPESEVTIFDCPGAGSTVTTVMDGSGGTASLVPVRLPSTPPENVVVSIISGDSLGVTWDPPKYMSNGLPVVKYLVQWDSDAGFVKSEVGSGVSHAEAAAYSEVVVGLKHQILDLEEGTPYYIRVRAFTDGDGYGSPATFLFPQIPIPRPAYVPNNVHMTVSDDGAPDQLLISWNSPNLDAETQLFDTKDGGSPITHYVISYAPVGLHLPSMEESTMSMRALGSCPDLCEFPLGAEVQSVSIYNENAGSGISSGEFIIRLPNGDTSNCISYGSNIYTELSTLLDPAVKVSKEAITVPGIGEKYWITFAGETLSGNYDGLIEFQESSSCSIPWLAGMGINTNSVRFLSNEETIGGILTPGVPYSVFVAPLNDVGLGTKLSAEADASSCGSLAGTTNTCTPRSVPGSPLNVMVMADPADETGILVAWSPPTDLNGGQILSYLVEYTVAGSDTYSSESFEPNILNIALNIAPVPGCGSSYEVRVLALNDMGASVPVSAEVTCSPLANGCVDEGSIVQPRRLPLAPALLTVPEVGGEEFFSASSLAITVDPDVLDLGCPSITPSFFELEWDTISSFSSQVGGRPLSYDIQMGSSPVVSYVSGAPSRYTITDLSVGVPYYIRARSKNSLGFGPFTLSKVAVPLTSSDPPPVPIRLEQLTSTSYPESSRAVQGRSLLVSWSAPVVSPEHLDLWGSGGSPVTSYLVEWSASPFEEFEPPIQLISCNCGGETGVFRVTPPDGSVPTAWVNLDADAQMVKIALENLPDVRTVEASDVSSGSWRVTFTSELEEMANPLDVEVRCNDGSTHIVSDLTIESQGAALPLGYERLEVSPESRSLVLTDLIPGVVYYARVSAGTQLGYGRSRAAQPFGGEGTTPSGGMTVPIFPPDPPVSYWHSGGVPTLSREGSSSLRVTMGAPVYDGGDRLHSFEIEYDTTPFFTTSHFVSVPATQHVCDTCITGFTYSTSTLHMSGTDWGGTFFGTVDIGNRILVNGIHVFTVANFSATSSVAAIIVEPSEHNALSDLAFTGGATMSIYGVSYIISGLEEGVLQYVRIYSRNNEAGAGNPAFPYPPAIAPLGPPPPPVWVNVSVSDAQDKLNIEFPNVFGADDHLIEVFKSGVENAGVKEVQSITTSGNPTAGNSFTLSFGSANVPVMSSTGDDNVSISAEEGQSTLMVTGGLDLTHELRRGDPLKVGGSEYLVHSLRTFDELTVPLADSSAAVPSLLQLLGTSDLINGYTGPTASGLIPLRKYTTQPISAVATAAEMEEALEALPSISDLTVRREETSDGFVWLVTFEGPHVGDVDLLGLNGRKIGVGSSV